MIVRAIGLTSERVVPCIAVARPEVTEERIDWLVLSSDRGTRDTLLGVIRRNGRKGHSGHARLMPARAIAAWRYRLAFVDLAHRVGSLAELDSWANGLRLQRSRLMVRGSDGVVEDELWARERGAVLYLPGEIALAGLDQLIGELSA